MTFRGGANGNEAPIRVIMGPKTQLRLFDKLSVDPVNDEILVFFGNQVMFFDRTATGDVAPKRILNPPGLNANNAVVDPVHNLLVVSGGNKIWIFDRTAEGNATPKAIIGGGPKSGLLVGQGMALYPPTGSILVTSRGVQAASNSPEGLASDKAFVGVWNITDSGDVPPRWTIAGPQNNTASAARRHPGSEEQERHRQRQIPERRPDVIRCPELFDTGARQTAQAALP